MALRSTWYPSGCTHYSQMNQQSIEIRNMVMNDIDTVLFIENSVFPAPWSRDVFLRELQLPISRNLVATIRMNQIYDITGYMTYWVIAGEIQIHKIAVREDIRRAGIASALLDVMIRRSCKESAVSCTLEVGRSNEGAKRLYEKFGFIVTDVRPRYYAESGDDALIMWADLKNCLQFIHKEENIILP
jgi:ribosomal-protein-alanine N-acetyltransferase